MVRISGKRGNEAGRLDGSGGMETREDDLSYVSRMAVVERLKSLEEELKMMKKNHYSLIVSLQLMHRELERVKEELRKRYVFIKRTEEAAEAKECDGGGQGSALGEGKKRQRYEIYAQECFCSFARAVHEWLLKYANLETCELCFDRKSLAWS